MRKTGHVIWFIKMISLTILLFLSILTPTNGDTNSSTMLPDSASQAWLSSVQEDIKQSEYNVKWQEKTTIPGLVSAWHVSNHAHNLRAYFPKEGIRVTPWERNEHTWVWGISLTGYGVEGSLKDVDPVTPAIKKNSVSYDRVLLKEWYINDEKGIEQGFTLLSPPPANKNPSSKIVLAMRIEGDLTGSLYSENDILEFKTENGVSAIQMTKLKVIDAEQKILPASYRLYDKNVEILIDTADATYPIIVDPLIGSPWIAEGDQALTFFGQSVAGAGDVNGDGYPDVIVGAMGPNSGAGRAYLYYGSAAGLSSTPAWTADGEYQYDSFGSAVAGAGDVNGDGYDDVIVGAKEYNTGKVYLYYGSAAGLSSTPTWTAEGGPLDGDFGGSVVGAGDVNKDGYADIIVGSEEYNTYTGKAYLYYGSATGPGSTPGWTAEGEYMYDSFGCSLAGVGDVNKDTYPDIIVGAEYYNNDTGKAYLYYGSASGLSSTPAWTDEGAPDDSFGSSIAGAGDVNGDGYADVIVGASGYNLGTGKVYLYYGSASGLGGTPAGTVVGDSQLSSFGGSVAGVGDVNDDGYDDVIVGAWDYNFTGKACFYYGSASGLGSTPVLIVSDQANARLGYSVAGVGDVDGDGYADFIIGAPWYDNGESNEGIAAVYYGQTYDVDFDGMDDTWEVTYFGDTTRDGTGDFDRDLLPDFGEFTAGTNPGLPDTDGDEMPDGWEVQYYLNPLITDASGNPDGDGYTNLQEYQRGSDPQDPDSPRRWLTIESDQASARLGWSSTSAGDVNGDNYPDIIVGAPYYNSQTGRVYVYYGSASGVSSTPAWTEDGETAGDQFGYSVACAGDVNNDGYDDVIVGAPYYGSGYGRAYIYFGSASGLSSTPDWYDTGFNDITFGYSVASAGDLNNDNYSDVIIGAPDRYGTMGPGYAFVYYGSATGPAGTFDWGLQGYDQAYLGISVAGAGDFNNDGYDDVIIGEPGYLYTDGQETHLLKGSISVYYGSAQGLDSISGWDYISDLDNFSSLYYFGNFVTGAGDVNHDGYSDVIAGDKLYTYVFYGSASGQSTHWSIRNYGGFYLEDKAKACTVDVNGDSYLDVLVGNNGQDRVDIYYGSASGINDTVDWSYYAYQADAQFGHSLAGVGDLNNDGYPEFIVGAPYYDNGGNDGGRAYVYYGLSDFDDDGMPDSWERTYFGDMTRDGTADYDDDGANDLIEYQSGSNPILTDTDSDGMPDGWEIGYNLDPVSDNSSADNDSDGLTDFAEYQNGTNPDDSDSDDDGLNDGSEVNTYSSNPNLSDTDSDNINDGDEVNTYGTNPILADTDSDGMPDGWEVQYPLNPLVNDASEDLDEDGYTNLEEYKRDKDPNDPNSHPVKSMPWLMLLLE